MALAKLETPSYFQDYQMVDKYIDNFWDLINHARYTKAWLWSSSSNMDSSWTFRISLHSS
jgi:hypothetical protein